MHLKWFKFYNLRKQACNINNTLLDVIKFSVAPTGLKLCSFNQHLFLYANNITRDITLHSKYKEKNIYLELWSKLLHINEEA